MVKITHSYFPDTTRSIRPGETNGKDYYFVSREQMEEEIEAGKFIEYGEYKGNLYGTSLESVLSLVNAGYVCIISPHYQVSFVTVWKEYLYFRLKFCHLPLFI